MNTISLSFRMTVLAVLVAGMASAAPNNNAADQEARKRAQALAALAKTNNQKVSQLKRTVEATWAWSWNNKQKTKDFKAIHSNLTEMVRLVTLKEGAADCMTRGDVLLLKAYAYAKPVNLRLYAEAKAAYDEALKAQEDPDRKAKVAFARARYLFTCGQEDAEACEKAMIAAYETPGIKPATKFAMLKDGVPGKTLRVEGRVLADAEFANDPTLLRDWYTAETTGPNWQTRDKLDPLDPICSAAYRVKMCDEALAKLPPKVQGGFLSRKIAALRELSKWNEAEQLLMGQLSSITNVTDRRRVSVYGDLADLYVARAARYYQKPDEALTRKAIWFWEEGVRIDPKNGQFLQKIVERAMLIDDYDLASRTLDALTALAKDGKPDSWICAVRGDIAYYREDYEAAVKWYQTFPRFPDGPSVVRIPNSHQRFAGALFATGRYEECLKAIDQCPNMWSFKDTNAQYRKILKAKIEAAKER